MNLTVNSIGALDKSRYAIAQKPAPQNRVSFEGSSTAPSRTTNVLAGITLLLASLFGLNACKSDKSEEVKEVTTSEYVAPAQSVEEPEPEQEVVEEVSYEDKIYEFMDQDDRIVDVKIKDGLDPNYINSYRMITGKGYDKNGKLIKELVIHPKEPSESSVTPVYCPEPEFKHIDYFSDKKVTVCSDSEEEGTRTVTEYTKPVKYMGVPGFKKTVTLYDVPTRYDDVVKIVKYEKGKKEQISSESIVYSKDYRYCEESYDKDKKLISRLYFVPNKYSELELDEKKSIQREEK